MSENAKPATPGLYLIGQIMHTEHIPGAEGRKEKFVVEVFVPGWREIFRVSVNAADFLKFKVGEMFKAAVRMNIYKGAAYWQPA